MPEPNPKAPVYATTYGPQSLDTLRRQGIQVIEFWCVGGRVHGRRCEHRQTKRIDDLIRQAGPGTSLVRLARRARCDICKKVGCHVQPADPPGPGMPGYREWLRDELERCQEFIMWGRDQL